MSAKTANLATQVKPLVAHVPVDRFEIVHGPSAMKCMEAQEHVSRGTPQNPCYFKLIFTLKTAASNEEFKRDLMIASIFGVEQGHGGVFGFTAIFSGRIVSGYYYIQSQVGWFNLD